MVCTASVRFQPKAPGERRGAILFLDSQETVLARQSLYGVGLGPVAVFSPATINTVAGNGQWLYTGDGSQATDSPIFLPGGVAVNPAGTMYIADSGNNRIRRVDAATGIITTVAGTGSPGSGNDGGAATAASISDPSAVLLDGAGDLYIADSANHAVRKLVLATGKLITVAGQLNQQGYTGDGGPATSATLNMPEGLALDAAGNLYIADTKNHVIRKVDAVTRIISTYAGTGGVAGFAGDGGPAAAAKMNAPWGLASDVSGNLYIADLNNNRIRKVSAGGVITTVVGDGTGAFAIDGQSALATSIDNPAAVAVDVAGNLYVADSGHNIVRKVNASTNLVSVVAGGTISTFSGDKGPSTAAGLYGPYALTIDSSGNLYVADIFHHRIREILNARATLAYSPIRVGRTSAAQQQTLENDGNSDLTWTSFDLDQNATISSATTTCVIGTPLAIDGTCSIGVQFSPQTTGAMVTAAVRLVSDAGNSPATVTLSGEVDELDPTQTTLSSSVNPSALGASLSFTAQVSGGAVQPSGTVRFYDGATQIGSAATDASGTAIFPISTLTLGSHSVTANFTGDVSNSPSTSASLVQVVKQAAAVNLNSSLNPARVGNSISYTATVSGSSVQPTGTVLFSDGATALGTVALSSAGSAVYTASNLVAGDHAITATYSGDANTLAGPSPAVTQTISKWPSKTTLSSSIATAEIGTTATLTVSVAPSSTMTPLGTVVVMDESTPLATLTLDNTGVATYSTNSLAVGTHPLTAVFGGDATNAGSTSAIVIQTVNKIATATTLSSSANPAKGGAAVRFTATVTPDATSSVAGVLTGSITFNDGSTILGAATIAPSGIATLDVSTLSVATHPITAVYSGSTNFGASTSAAVAEEIKLATTSVQLSSSANPTIAGRGLIVTAVVSGDGAIPSGTVSFLDGATPLGTVAVNASGQATLSLTTLITGSHAITASYGGDAKDSPSTSSVLTQAVSQATTATTLATSSNPAIAGTTISFVATVSSDGSLPSGQLLLREGSATLGTAVISATGSAQFSLGSLSAGSHTLNVVFAGDVDHAASTSSALNQVVQLASSSARLGASENPSIVGSPVTFAATITGAGQQPTGNVVFLDGATTLGSAPLSSAGAATLSTSLLTVGSHTITLVYAGDTTHAASSPASLIERVQQATTTGLVSSRSPSIVGSSVTFTAKVAGAGSGTFSGTVAFSDGATLLGSIALSSTGEATFQTASLPAGTHLITAAFSGDENNRASVSAGVSQMVVTANTTVTLASNANPSIAGNTTTFTAAVVSQGNSPTGAVTFLDGAVVLGSGSLANGLASFSTSSLPAGAHAITARYAGDSGTQLSTSSVLPQVVQQHTTTALITSSNPILTNQSFTLTSTVSNGSKATGIVTFLDGAASLGAGAVSPTGVISITVPALAAGAHSIVARYSGDSYNLNSDSAILTELVQLRPSTTSVTASSASYLDGQQVTLVAVVHFTGPVTPTGTVTFTAGGKPLGTATVASAGAATLVLAPSASSYDIVAAYSGDAAYTGSISDPYTISHGSSTTFNMTSDPADFTLASGGHQMLTLNLTSSSSFSDTVSFACLNLPIDATCTFAKNHMDLGAGATTTVQLVFDTGNPLGSGARARLEQGSSSNVMRAGFLLPLGAALGWLLYRARRSRRLPALLALLLIASTGLGLSGCGSSLNVSKTPAGAYTVRVIATGNKTGISQITNLSVTVH